MSMDVWAKEGKKMGEKKNVCRELEWATAHFGVGSRYRRLYRDTRQLGARQEVR